MVRIPTFFCIERCIIYLDSIDSSAFRERRSNFVSQTFTVTLSHTYFIFSFVYFSDHASVVVEGMPSNPISLDDQWENQVSDAVNQQLPSDTANNDTADNHIPSNMVS